MNYIYKINNTIMNYNTNNSSTLSLIFNVLNRVSIPSWLPPTFHLVHDIFRVLSSSWQSLYLST